jgi:hypothetical protein
MNRLPVMIAIVVGMIATLCAPVARSATVRVSLRRQAMIQINECMKKRMDYDQAISYNDAARLCTQLVNQQIAMSVSGPLVAADTSGKR